MLNDFILLENMPHLNKQNHFECLKREFQMKDETHNIVFEFHWEALYFSPVLPKNLFLREQIDMIQGVGAAVFDLGGCIYKKSHYLY